MEILCILMGVFAGFTAGGYMFIRPLAERDRTITQKTNDFIQLNEELNSMRAELEDLKFDLSVARREMEQKDKIVEKMQVVINDFITKEEKLSKLNELVKHYQSIN